MKKINVIITGSEGTVGNALSKYLIENNYTVINIDIKNIKKKNYYKCDINNEEQVESTIKKIIKKFQTIDVIVNSASYNPKQSKTKSYKISNYSLQDWKKNIEVDLIGTFNITKNVLKIFEKQNFGKVINISSNYGLVGPDQDIYYENKRPKYYGKKPIEYSMCKSAVIGLTKGLASFYKKTDIKVMCLVLGGIYEKKDNKFTKKYGNKTILGRMLKRNEYNEIFKFLIDSNIDYLSGSIIDCSGGSLSIL